MSPCKYKLHIMWYCGWWRYVEFWSTCFHKTPKPTVCYNFKGSGTFWDQMHNFSSTSWQVSCQEFCGMIFNVLKLGLGVHSVRVCYSSLSCLFKGGHDRTWRRNWPCYTRSGLHGIPTLIGCDPSLFTPALLCVFDHVSCRGPIFHIKVPPTNVLASMSSTLELMALLHVLVGYHRDWVVEGIYWGLPIFWQTFWFNKLSFIINI